MKFTDDRVCKSHLLDCCPHDILAGTVSIFSVIRSSGEADVGTSLQGSAVLCEYLLEEIRLSVPEEQS